MEAAKYEYRNMVMQRIFEGRTEQAPLPPPPPPAPAGAATPPPSPRPQTAALPSSLRASAPLCAPPRAPVRHDRRRRRPLRRRRWPI